MGLLAAQYLLMNARIAKITDMKNHNWIIAWHSQNYSLLRAGRDFRGYLVRSIDTHVGPLRVLGIL